MDECWRLDFLTLFFVTTLFCSVLSIDCFSCQSVDGSNRACEDKFYENNETKPFLVRKCRVGYFRYRARFCVKIKGIKEDGQSVVIRTCSFSDWGSVCGSVKFEHGSEDNKEYISGCLQTCNFDGCNKAEPTYPRSHFPVLSVLAAAVLTSWSMPC